MRGIYKIKVGLEQREELEEEIERDGQRFKNKCASKSNNK